MWFCFFLNEINMGDSMSYPCLLVTAMLRESCGYLSIKEATDRFYCHASLRFFSFIIDSSNFFNKSLLLFTGFRP